MKTYRHIKLFNQKKQILKHVKSNENECRVSKDFGYLFSCASLLNEEIINPLNSIARKKNKKSLEDKQINYILL